MLMIVMYDMNAIAYVVWRERISGRQKIDKTATKKINGMSKPQLKYGYRPFVTCCVFCLILSWLLCPLENISNYLEFPQTHFKFFDYITSQCISIMSRKFVYLALHFHLQIIYIYMNSQTRIAYACISVAKWTI